jgi:hypothetical protein
VAKSDRREPVISSGTRGFAQQKPKNREIFWADEESAQKIR